MYHYDLAGLHLGGGGQEGAFATLGHFVPLPLGNFNPSKLNTDH